MTNEDKKYKAINFLELNLSAFLAGCLSLG